MVMGQVCYCLLLEVVPMGDQRQKKKSGRPEGGMFIGIFISIWILCIYMCSLKVGVGQSVCTYCILCWVRFLGQTLRGCLSMYIGGLSRIDTWSFIVHASSVGFWRLLRWGLSVCKEWAWVRWDIWWLLSEFVESMHVCALGDVVLFE
jgi:hypothetical protein